MKSVLGITVALVLPALLVADYSENKIEDFRIRRLSFGRRYSVRKCQACATDQCQVMGMQRFSEPRCEAFGEIGSVCRVDQEAENKTLHFPHGIMKCNNVYVQFCPCAPGLVCEEAECRPKTTEREERNILDAQDGQADEMPSWLEFNRSKFPWAVARYH